MHYYRELAHSQTNSNLISYVELFDLISVQLLVECCICSNMLSMDKSKRSHTGNDGAKSDSLCQNNVTAKAGMVARLFCCLAVQNRDSVVSQPA